MADSEGFETSNLPSAMYEKRCLYTYFTLLTEMNNALKPYRQAPVRHPAGDGKSWPTGALVYKPNKNPSNASVALGKKILLH